MPTRIPARNSRPAWTRRPIDQTIADAGAQRWRRPECRSTRPAGWRWSAAPEWPAARLESCAAPSCRFGRCRIRRAAAQANSNQSPAGWAALARAFVDAANSRRDWRRARCSVTPTIAVRAVRSWPPLRLVKINATAGRLTQTLYRLPGHQKLGRVGNGQPRRLRLEQLLGGAITLFA